MGAGVIQSLLGQLRAHRGILALLLFTLVVRGGLMIVKFDELSKDPDQYYRIASNVVRFAAFSIDDPTTVGQDSSDPRPSAFRPPLYPIVLSNLAIGKDKIIHWGSIALLHIGLGLATVGLTWRIAHSLQLGWASYLAGVLIACDPILLRYQSQVMTETLATFCAVLAWGLLVRFHFERNWWNAALAGGAIGMAAMCRPTFLPWVPVAVVMVFILQPGKFVPRAEHPGELRRPLLWNQRLLSALALSIGACGVMFPWAWRNYQVFQRPILTTTHGGYTLYLANNRHFYRYLREDQSGLPWDPRTKLWWTAGSLEYQQSFREERRSAFYYGPTAPFSPTSDNDERAVDKYQTKLAIEAMVEDPAGFAHAALYRVRQLWTPLPHRTEPKESRSHTLLRYLSAAWYLAVYALALIGIYHLRGNLWTSPWVFGLALCLIFTAVHIFYFCNVRMRAPLMPFVAVVAGVGAREIAKRFPLARRVSA
jgi:hypothetical protein